MVNFGPLAAEIFSLVWGSPANFKGFRVLAALLHGTLEVGVSQTLWRSTEGATYIRQGGHHVGHWPTFLVCIYFIMLPYYMTNKDYHIFRQAGWQVAIVSGSIYSFKSFGSKYCIFYFDLPSLTLTVAITSAKFESQFVANCSDLLYSVVRVRS